MSGGCELLPVRVVKLVPQTSGGRAPIERELGRFKNEYGLTPLRSLDLSVAHFTLTL